MKKSRFKYKALAADIKEASNSPLSKFQEDHENDYKLIEGRTTETVEEREQRLLKELLGIF